MRIGAMWLRGIALCGLTAFLGCATSTESEVTSALPISNTVSQPNATQKREVKLAVAHTLEQTGNIDGAMQAYASILAASNDPAAAHRMAVLLDRKGKHGEAKKQYELALELGADRAKVLCDYGYSMYLQGHYSQAEACLNECLSLREGDYPRASTNLGLTLARQGNLTGALAAFQGAGCSEADARVNVAHVLLQDGRVNEAFAATQDALRFDPRHSEATDLAQRINGRLNDRMNAESSMPRESLGPVHAAGGAPVASGGPAQATPAAWHGPVAR